MAALNLSTNGQSINRSYQGVVDAPAPAGAAASSGGYGQWAIFSVSAPLTSAFQQDGGSKESVLKVQGSGEGDLNEMIEEFSDGRIQFAFLKVKDPNTSLPKYALIGWCGEGVPERTKGYFTSHLSTVSKVLSGYHVQIAARSDRDLTPEGIMQKVSDASGSRYTGGPAVSGGGGPPPKPATKPVFMPTQSGGGGGFNPLGRSQRAPVARDTNVDADGWGADAPPVTRTQVEKVAPAYQPTKVDMRALGSQNTSSATSRNEAIATGAADDRPDVVRGAYQPVGKVDIDAIRRQAATHSTTDNRPTPVKGAYEPVGKVDIAAIKAKARQDPPPAAAASSNDATEQADAPPSVSSRAAAFTSAAPITELPKPKVANKFGGSSTFAGTKAPLPGGPGITPAPPAAAAGASRTFADKGGKTPAQLWAEKKGMSGRAGAPTPAASVTSPIAAQTSGGGGWKSGYTGKSWAQVQTTKTGGSAGSAEREEEQEQDDTPSGRVGALREALGQSTGGGFPGQAGVPASSPSPPPLDTSTKPGAGGAARGVPIPGLPPRGGAADAAAAAIPPPPQPRTPTPEAEEDEGSPIRVAMPVSSTQPAAVEDAHAEQFSPPVALPVRSIAQEAAAREASPSPEPEPASADLARGAAAHVAAATFGEDVAAAAPSHTAASAGLRAVVLYDYEKAEDNELQLVEGEYVDNIEQVDPDWWMGQTSNGAAGLFPSNYVELVEGEGGEEEEHGGGHHPAAAAAAPTPPPAAPAAAAARPSATALYDYEAAEDNELTFPEGAKITNVEFPDEDWWAGEYGGHSGLFPANYVQLDA